VLRAGRITPFRKEKGKTQEGWAGLCLGALLSWEGGSTSPSPAKNVRNKKKKCFGVFQHSVNRGSWVVMGLGDRNTRGETNW